MADIDLILGTKEPNKLLFSHPLLSPSTSLHIAPLEGEIHYVGGFRPFTFGSVENRILFRET